MACEDGPLISSYVDDSDMMEIVQIFVAEMSDRIRALESAHATQDLAALRSLAHQMRGAAGGFGFSQVTDSAGALEDSLRQGADPEQVRCALTQLLALMRRVRLHSQQV